MTITDSILIERTGHSRIGEINWDNLEFGKYLSDHMFVAEYKEDKWQSLKIQPYGGLNLSPAILSLHYGQSVFEGLKAFKNQDGDICIFRADKHGARLNKSLERMCMPALPLEMFMESLKALIEVDRDWIPTAEGASLYLRPLVFATEERFGVKIADKYLYVLMTSPVGPYFSKPVRLKVEDHFVRAAEGGTGYAKCAGNYGGAFYPNKIAKEQGFDQVIWTDAKEHKYIDEVGVMNAMFVLDGKLITPVLNTAILEGVTRDSILTLAPILGIPVEERRISVQEIESGFQQGILTEAFGTGTAAVVSPIATINIGGRDYDLPDVTPQSFQSKVKEKLNNIRMGVESDLYGWNTLLKF